MLVMHPVLFIVMTLLAVMMHQTTKQILISYFINLPS
jgi:hypothetical protein